MSNPKSGVDLFNVLYEEQTCRKRMGVDSCKR